MSCTAEDVAPLAGPVRFNEANPPSSLKVARERIAFVREKEKGCEVQLEFKEPDDFATDDEYDAWKVRAMAALGFIRAEKEFLADWIKSAEKLEALHVSAKTN